LAIEAVTDAGVRIEFCLPCGYLNRAAKLAESLFIEFEDHIPSGVTLIPGTGGVFEVWLNEEQVFSKKALGRFPEAREIESLLEPKIFD
jgi:selenoprotein W-related protein